MNTRVGLNHFFAAAGATVITAVGAWAFASSGVPAERDRFQFASVMTANASLHMAQRHRGAASTCPNNPEAWDPLAPMCLRV